MQLYLKRDRALKEGILPPELSDAVKLGMFKVVALDEANSKSAALAMPGNAGIPLPINGKTTQVWWVHNTDLYGENQPRTEEKASTDKSNTSTADPASTKTQPQIKAGDIVKLKDRSYLPSSISQEEHERGFRVVNCSYSNVVIELPNGKGDLRESSGKSTYAVRTEKVSLHKSYKFKIGDYVRVLSTGRGNLYSSLSSSDYFHGFKILGWDDKEVVLEMPPGKGNQGTGKYSGKTIRKISREYIEYAPDMDYRVGDKIKLKRSYIPDRIPKKDRWKKAEITEVLGDFGGFRYTLKLSDGTKITATSDKFDVNVKNDSEQENSMGFKFKKGMKVSIKEDRKYDLPDALDSKARSGTFEVLDFDERDDDVVLKMPSSCNDAEFDSEYNCRVWHIDVNAIEVKGSQGKTEGKSMAKKIDRSSAGFVERLQANAEQGAIKTAGRKLTKMAKAAILGGLESIGRKHGMDENQISSGLKLFQAFMESENGSAVISTFIGQVLAHGAPKLPFPIFQDERIQDLADEMSSEGMAIVMEGLVNVVLENFAPSLGAILEGLPPKKETAPAKPAKKSAAKKKKKSTVQVGKHEIEVEEDDDDEDEKEVVQVAAHRARAN